MMQNQFQKSSAKGKQDQNLNLSHNVQYNCEYSQEFYPKHLNHCGTKEVLEEVAHNTQL